MGSSLDTGVVRKVLITLLRGTISVSVLAPFSAVWPVTAQTGNSVTLLWNASTNPGVVGYRVHYGTASGNYTQNKDVGNIIGTTVSTLTAGQTY
jgi:hypothetical protein